MRKTKKKKRIDKLIMKFNNYCKNDKVRKMFKKELIEFGEWNYKIGFKEKCVFPQSNKTETGK